MRIGTEDKKKLTVLAPGVPAACQRSGMLALVAQVVEPGVRLATV